MCKKLLSVMDGVEVHMDLSDAVSQIARRTTFSENGFAQRIDVQEIVGEFTPRRLGRS